MFQFSRNSPCVDSTENTSFTSSSIVRRCYWGLGWTVASQRLSQLSNQLQRPCHRILQCKTKTHVVLIYIFMCLTQIFQTLWFGFYALFTVCRKLLPSIWTVQVMIIMFLISYRNLWLSVLNSDGYNSVISHSVVSDYRLSVKLVSTFVDRGVLRSELGGSPMPIISVSRPELLLFLSSSSSVVLMRLSGLRSRRTTSQKIW
jgi:hypothetical protein